MAKYKVICPKGVLVGETVLKKGETIDQPKTSAQVRAWLRFRQIAPVEEAPADKPPVDEPPAESAPPKPAADKPPKPKPADK